MKHEEQLDYLIRYLISEDSRYVSTEIPITRIDKKFLFRSLLSIRSAKPISQEFIAIQDKFLKNELKLVGLTSIKDLTPIQGQLYLWKGDITHLQVDDIVNAGNRSLLGCFIPCHNCIDNAIHSFAGVQLRLECHAIMKQQGRPEETGRAKITIAYNLPSKYVLHLGLLE